MAKYDVARLDEFDGVVKKLRRALGVTAFGVNYFDLPPGTEGLEHNETQTNQEEVYVYVKGSGRLRLAGEAGLQWVAIGAPKDGRYQPPSWG